MITIAEKVLQNAVKEGAYIGIVNVTETKVLHQGTRGERAIIDIKLEHTISGDNLNPVGISFYTSNGQTVLSQGKKYLVVLHVSNSSRPYMRMEAYQELDCIDCQNIIDTCKKTINLKK